MTKLTNLKHFNELKKYSIIIQLKKYLYNNYNKVENKIYYIILYQ